MSGKKVYVVTQGSYSDYGIVAIFSTQELAEQYVAPLQTGYSPPHVEEWDLDEPFELAPSGTSQYFGTIVLETGEVKQVQQMSYFATEKPMMYDEMDWTRGSDRRYAKTGNRELRVYFFARDDDHAAKILAEKRQEYLRSGL